MTSVTKCAEETTSTRFGAVLREEVRFDHNLASCLGLPVAKFLECHLDPG